MVLRKIIKLIKDPRRLVLFLSSKGYFKWVPDDKYLKIIFKNKVGYNLDLNSPLTFNEKLQWLKLNDKNPKYIKWVDKYEVRKYIKELIGERYLIPLLGIYNTFEQINFNILPKQFVLKCTHDSGGVVICEDKDKFDLEGARKKLNRGLSKNYYYHGREWPYKNINPRIICEKYMADESGTELKDYKFMCFNGEVKCSFVCLNRGSKEGLNVDFYDMDWNPMPFERHYPKSDTIIAKPKNFDKMVQFAEKLSKDIPFVRVDFYEIDGKLYFGELTFYPGSGFEEFTPESYDYLLGSWINLDNE